MPLYNTHTSSFLLTHKPGSSRTNKKFHRYALQWIFSPTLAINSTTRIMHHRYLLYQIQEIFQIQFLLFLAFGSQIKAICFRVLNIFALFYSFLLVFSCYFIFAIKYVFLLHYISLHGYLLSSLVLHFSCNLSQTNYNLLQHHMLHYMHQLNDQGHFRVCLFVLDV